MTGDRALAELSLGFAHPVFDSQSVFRTIMLANAYPGRVFALDRDVAAPPPLGVATAAICLTLLDFETRLWLGPGAGSNEALRWLRFHCGVPIVDDHHAAHFALLVEPLSMPRLSDFNPGEVESPELGSTLIIQVASLTDGPPTHWSGPGIQDVIVPQIAGLPGHFWEDRGLCSELYPRGIDVFLTSGNALIGLPRTTLVEG